MISTKQPRSAKLQSKLGEVLTEMNIVHEKNLEEKIRKIESSRSAREIDLFIQQRAFFINHVFEGDEVKFAKFKKDRRYNHLESMKEPSSKHRNKHRVETGFESQDDIAQVHLPNRKAQSNLLQEKLFIGDRHRSSDSYNMQKIARAERRLSNQRAIISSRFASTPVEDVKEDFEFPRFENMYTKANGQDTKKDKSSHKSLVSSIPRLIHRTAIKFQSAKPLTVENLAILDSKNKKKGAFKVELMQRFLASEVETDVSRLDNVDESYHSHGSPSSGYDKKMHVSPSSGHDKKSQEQLLRKLTKTLPHHLLKETEKLEGSPSSSKKARKYLKNVLGIHQMKHLMLKKEKTLASMDHRNDPRLNDLVQYLDS